MGWRLEARLVLVADEDEIQDPPLPLGRTEDDGAVRAVASALLREHERRAAAVGDDPVLELLAKVDHERLHALIASLLGPVSAQGLRVVPEPKE